METDRKRKEKDEKFTIFLFFVVTLEIGFDYHIDDDDA